MDRITRISSLYRGQIPYKFEEKTLLFQPLSWDNEDQVIDDLEDEDKKYKDKTI